MQVLHESVFEKIVTMFNETAHAIKVYNLIVLLIRRRIGKVHQRIVEYVGTRIRKIINFSIIFKLHEEFFKSKRKKFTEEIVVLM